MLTKISKNRKKFKCKMTAKNLNKLKKKTNKFQHFQNEKFWKFRYYWISNFPKNLKKFHNFQKNFKNNSQKIKKKNFKICIFKKNKGY